MYCHPDITARASNLEIKGKFERAGKAVKRCRRVTPGVRLDKFISESAMKESAVKKAVWG